MTGIVGHSVLIVGFISNMESFLSPSTRPNRSPLEVITHRIESLKPRMAHALKIALTLKMSGNSPKGYERKSPPKVLSISFPKVLSKHFPTNHMMMSMKISQNSQTLLINFSWTAILIQTKSMAKLGTRLSRLRSALTRALLSFKQLTPSLLMTNQSKNRG